MVVEDDAALREIYSIRITAEGYEVVSAGDGEDALAVAVREKPDLILSDVMMPKISGFDMLDILRSTPETANIKVVMMTALSSEDQRARGERLGADKYLVKSQVGIEDVINTIHEVLGDRAGAAAPAEAAPAPAPATTDAAPAPAPAPVEVTPTPVPAPAEVAPTPAEATAAPTPTPISVSEAPAPEAPVVEIPAPAPVLDTPVAPVVETPIPEPTPEQPAPAPEPVEAQPNEQPEQPAPTAPAQ